MHPFVTNHIQCMVDPLLISNISIMDVHKEVFIKADKVVVDDWSQCNREKKTIEISSIAIPIGLSNMISSSSSRPGMSPVTSCPSSANNKILGQH
jgi:hypothetical protein